MPMAFESNCTVGNGTFEGPLPTISPFWYRTTVFTVSVSDCVMAKCVQTPRGIGPEERICGEEREVQCGG